VSLRPGIGSQAPLLACSDGRMLSIRRGSGSAALMRTAKVRAMGPLSRRLSFTAFHVK